MKENLTCQGHIQITGALGRPIQCSRKAAHKLGGKVFCQQHYYPAKAELLELSIRKALQSLERVPKEFDWWDYEDSFVNAHGELLLAIDDIDV